MTSQDRNGSSRSLRSILGRTYRALRGQRTFTDHSAWPGDYAGWRSRFVVQDRARAERRGARLKGRHSWGVVMPNGRPEGLENQFFAPDGTGTWNSLPDCDWLLLCPEDVELLPQALLGFADAAAANAEAAVLYADEEYGSAEDLQPYFKPEWSPEYWESTNYLGAVAVRADLLRQVHKASDDMHETLALVLAAARPQQVIRIPHILTRRPQPSGVQELELHASAVTTFIEQTGSCIESAEPFTAGSLHVCHALPNPIPRVSIIVPTRDRLNLVRNCVESVLEKSTYDDFELLLIDNDSREQDCVAWFAEAASLPKTRVLRYPHPFNFAAINNYGAREATGDILVFLNDDTSVINGSWLTELVRQAAREPVGAVGALLYYPDDTVQHAGVVCGISKAHIAGHIHRGETRGSSPSPASLDCPRNYSVVTGACLTLRRSVFDQVRGFDEQFSVCYNDVDLCLRVQAAGYRNVWTPHAVLYHHENVSVAPRNEEQQKVYDREAALMRQRYGTELLFDRAFNPNRALDGEDGRPANQPRVEPLC